MACELGTQESTRGPLLSSSFLLGTKQGLRGWIRTKEKPGKWKTEVLGETSHR